MSEALGSSPMPMEASTLQPSQSPATWLEPIPLAYRRRRGAIAVFVGATISLALAAVQTFNGVPLENYWLSAIPTGIGVLRWRVWMARREVRRYATIEVQLSKKERIKAAWKWWAWSLGVAVMLLATQYANDRLWSDWFYALLPPVPLILIGMGLYLRRRDSVMTKEAYAEFGAREQERQQQSAVWEDQLGAILNRPLVRYPIAAGLVWLAYEWSQDPKAKSIHVIAALILALVAAREVALWLLGLGLVIGAGCLLFSGIAALPVSVAVIIGALIIASAVKK